MEKHLKPNAIIALNFLMHRQETKISERLLARDLGITSFGVADLLRVLHVCGLVRQSNQYGWEITESGKLARMLGTY